MLETTHATSGPNVDPGNSPGRTRPWITRDGKFLRAGGQRLWLRGVTYGSFASNDAGEQFPPFPVLEADFFRMREVGINTVRVYTPPSDRIADAAARAGLYLVPDICWGPRCCELDYPEQMRFMSEWIRGHARRLAGHPSILMYSLGNEIPPLIVRWYGRRRIEAFLRALHSVSKECAPDTLVTYVNHPPTEYLDLSFLDVVSYNIYLEREVDFRSYMDRLQTQANNRPLFLAEVGLDSRSKGLEAQARFLDWQLRAAFEKGLCGAAVYAWTDEWQIHDSVIEGWEFGITTSDRQPKPALSTVREVYHCSHNTLRKDPKPMVSVVVCAHNAIATIRECLNSLTRLNYPNYEVIVIDDGSTDGTGQLCGEYGARLLRIERGGLSRARNEGILAARGSIVGFIDADAYPDPDWLYFAVTALEEQQAAAVGGPNLAPPNDGFVAECVDYAPGNPTHVLIDDTRAEHIPGCNMIFRKSALAAVEMFDVTHRAAGDDVDVCWKLLARRETIAFSPSAVVWHHRRGTVSGFLRQQRGYGFAEAHLQNRYPGHYNAFGHAVWRGKVYDSASRALDRLHFPVLFRSRIYQGQFGSAQFQSIYQPFRMWWFQMFTTVEWMGLALAFTMAAALGLGQVTGATGRDPGAVVIVLLLSGSAVGMWAATASSALLAGRHAVNAARWTGASQWKGLLLVSALHIAQPLARAWGRLMGNWKLLGSRLIHPTKLRLYGNLGQRDAWLRNLNEYLQTCGWVARPNDDWEDSDLIVEGPGPVRLTLTSVYEDDLAHAQHFIRYQVRTRWKPPYLAAAAGFVLLTVLCLSQWYLLPLVVPWVLGALRILRARGTQSDALSQLALEVAKPLGMIPVEPIE